MSNPYSSEKEEEESDIEKRKLPNSDVTLLRSSHG
jgi:hypothetical protein